MRDLIYDLYDTTTKWVYLQGFFPYPFWGYDDISVSVFPLQVL